MSDHAEHLRAEGYAIVRGVFPPEEMAGIALEVEAIEREALRHHASWRDHNLYFEIVDDPALGRRAVVQAHWFSWK